MSYLIDGHNLIAQLPGLALDDPNDEAELVQRLNGFVARTKRKCVVVFDHGLPGGKSRMSTRAVQAVFASQRSSADRVMIERINKLPDSSGWVVVSSDQEVQAAARRRRMDVLTAGEFIELLKMPPAPDIDVGEAAHVRLSQEEVEEWLRLFGNQK